MKKLLLPLLALAATACAKEAVKDAPAAIAEETEQKVMVPDTAPVAYPSVGEIVYIDEKAKAIIPEGTVIEKLTEDKFLWSEGPLWINDGGYLLFTDVPANAIYKWQESTGLETFLQPVSNGGETSPQGSNGLIRAKDGGVLMGDHGDRAVTHLNLDTKEKTLVVSAYDGKKFSSPNDLVYGTSGAIYFTDPPYGLPEGDASPAKELDFNGVYRFVPATSLSDEILQIVDNGLTRPNGVIMSPDKRDLYVTVSDRDAAKIYKYAIDIDGLPKGRKEFFDFTPMVKEGKPGLPDGMAITTDGYLFSTGPGGVHVFDPEGTHIALIATGTAAANCTFGGVDGKTLYITSASFLARVELNTIGLGF